MQPADLHERLLSILEEVTGSAEVRDDPDLRLYESGLLDSLGSVTLMAMFEDAFGVRVSPAAFEPGMWATPRAIEEDLLRRVGA